MKEDKESYKEKYDSIIDKYEIKCDKLEDTLIKCANGKFGSTDSSFSFVEDNFTEAKQLTQMNKWDVPKLKAFKDILNNKNGKMEMCNVLQHHSLHDTLREYVGDIIKSIHHRKDKSTQKFFVTDCSRLVYIIRDIVGDELKWKRDPGGIIVAKRTIEPILEYLRELLSDSMGPYLEYLLKEFPNDHLESVQRIQRLTQIIGVIDDGRLRRNILKYLAPYFQLDKNIVENYKNRMIRKKKKLKKRKK